MREPRTAVLFRRQSHHECTFSHRSPRNRRSRELNQHAAIRPPIRVALHRYADDCLARNPGVDRRPRMARNQSFQPLVTQPTSCGPTCWAASFCRLPSLIATLGNPRWQTLAGRMELSSPARSHASERRARRHNSTRHARSAQSGWGARCATEWIASPRSVSLASCS